VAFWANASGSRHEIAFRLAQVGRERAFDHQRDVARRLRAQPIPIRTERKDRLDRVSAVGQLTSNVKRKIEFGRRDLPRGSGQGAALAELSPLASFAFTLAAVSSSAVTSAAFHA